MTLLGLFGVMAALYTNFKTAGFCIVILLLFAVGCTLATPTPDLDATLQVRVREQVEAELRTVVAQIPTATVISTATSALTATPAPTATHVPTDTPQPTPTSTPLPTATTPPTPTPRPTATRRPTPIPTATPSIADWSGRLEPWGVLVASSKGHGTGFFIQDPSSEDDWYVITNAHVVGNDRTVVVGWYSDAPVLPRVSVLGVDTIADVALLDASPDDFDVSITGLGNLNGSRVLDILGKGVSTSDDVQLGTEVLALGYAEGGGKSITRGHSIYRERLFERK